MFRLLVIFFLFSPQFVFAMESWDIETFKGYERDKVRALEKIERNLKKGSECFQKPTTAYEAALQKNILQRTMAENELVDLMMRAEKAKLRKELASSKSTIAKPRFTKKLTVKHDTQMKQVDVKYYHLAEVIKKLASGGSQEVRQKNYDEAVTALVDFSKSQRQWMDDWTDPKYYK